MFEEFESQLRRVVREELTAVLASCRLPSPGAGQQPELINITQACALANVGEATMRSYQKTGKLKRYGNGRVVLFDKAEVIRFLATPHCKASDELSADEWADMKLKKKGQQKQKEQ